MAEIVLGVAIKGCQLSDETMTIIYNIGTSNRELWRDFLASSVEKRENERMRWRGEWPEHTIIACGRICQQAVTERGNQRQMQVPTVYSLLCVYHIPVL